MGRRLVWKVTALVLGGLLMACQAGSAVQFEVAGTAPTTEAQAAEAHAAAAPATVAERLVDDATRRVLKMSNGFTIILQQNRTAPVVACRIYVRAGSLTEQQYMGSGISHVVEHLVAGATSGKRKEAENELLLQQIGNDSNAYTYSDRTCYFITTTAEKWPVAMDLLVDFTTNTDFTDKEFQREYQVVQREIEMDEAEPDRTFNLEVEANRYLVHPARHPVVGYKAAFQKITFDDVKAYYRQMYVPDNMIISVAGDIDLGDAEKRMVAQLSGLPRRRVPAIALPPEPAVAAPRVSVARGDVKKARVAWSFPTVTMYSPDMYAADILASVLGGSESSLLVRRLRDELHLVTGIDCTDETPAYVEGSLAISAVLDADKIPAAQKAVMDVLEEVMNSGVPEEAVQRAKAQATASMVYGNQTAEQQAERNALDFMATGNIDFTSVYVKRLQAVTAADVQAAARKYVKMERLLTTALLPANAVNPLAGSAGGQTAGTVEGALQKMVLKNGLTVLITRNPAAPLACFDLYSMGGLLAEKEATNGTGAAMMQLMARGTTTRTHRQITEFLDSTGTTLAATSGNNSFGLSVQCMKEHEAEAFALFADVALHPKFSAEDLESLRPELQAAVDESTEDWFSEALKATRDAYYADSPYKRMPVGRPEVAAKVSAEDLRRHYQEYFLDPQRMVLSISGDIDPETAARWAARFGDIPASRAALAPNSTVNTAGTIRKHTEKQSATIMLAYPPGSKIDGPDRYALTLLQTYLGGYSSPSGSVLHETLRGLGLVYTVQASNVAGPAGGMFLIAAQGEPQNADQIVAKIQGIVADTKAGRFNDTALAAAKDQTITGQRLSEQTIADKAQQEALDELLGLGFDEDKRFPERIKALTKSDVVRVANEYLKDPIIVITTPDAKK